MFDQAVLTIVAILFSAGVISFSVVKNCNVEHGVWKLCKWE